MVTDVDTKRSVRAAALDRGKYVARRALRVTGLDVHRAHGSVSGVRQRLTEKNAVEVVFDVGANRGQYGWELRAGGYEGRICSFEPLEEAYRVLQARTRKDPSWVCWPIALSDRNGTAVINVSANSVSSSLLPMAPLHLAADPASRNLGTAETSVRTLDDVVGESSAYGGGRYALKIDTQGHEWEVLDGAAETMRRCAWIEIELSLAELYTGQRLLPDLLDRLSSGFRLVQLEPVFSDPATGQLLQVNGMFAALDSTL